MLLYIQSLVASFVLPLELRPFAYLRFIATIQTQIWHGVSHAVFEMHGLGGTQSTIKPAAAGVFS